MDILQEAPGETPSTNQPLLKASGSPATHRQIILSARSVLSPVPGSLVFSVLCVNSLCSYPEFLYPFATAASAFFACLRACLPACLPAYSLACLPVYCSRLLVFKFLSSACLSVLRITPVSAVSPPPWQLDDQWDADRVDTPLRRRRPNKEASLTCHLTTRDPGILLHTFLPLLHRCYSPCHK